MKPSRTQARIIAVVLLAGVLPPLVSLAAYVLFGYAPHVQEPLHEGIELVGTCIALGVAMLLLLRTRHEEASPHLFWVVASLIAMGLVDGLHGIHGISLRSWQRHGATLAGGVLLGLVWLPLPLTVTRRKGLFAFVVAGLALALGLVLGSDWMPVTWDPVGLYTLPVKAANALGGLGFLAAALFFIRRYLRQPQTDDLVFASYAVLFGVASLLFGLSRTWAADWWVWHGFRLLAYAIVLVAAYEMVVTLYRQIAEHAQELEDRVQERTADLFKQREWLRVTLTSIGDAVIAADADGRISFLNQVAGELTGWPEPEALGQPIQSVFRVIDDQTRASVGNIAEQVLREGRVVTLANHTALLARDGREIPIEDSAAPIQDSAGRILGVVLVFHDVTERRHAQEALWQSEEKYRGLFDNAEVGMYRSRLDGSGIVALNQRLADIFGFTKEEMLSSPATMRWADPKAREEMVRVLRERGELRDHELDVVTKSGEVRTVLASMKLYPGEGYLEGTATDVTDRKRAEEAVRRSEGRLRELTESLPQLVWTCRADGPCDYLSPQWLTYTGIPEEEQLGFGWLEQLHPEDRAPTIGRWNASVGAGVFFEIEFRIRRHDGVYRWFKTRAVPLRDREGRVVKWFGTNSDIDDQKHAEEQLRRSLADLARSNQELEQFAYVASHDLQEPLRMISSYTQLLARKYEGQLDDKAKTYIDYAVDGAVRMQRLINDLLIYSRISTKGKPPEATDSHAVLGEALRNLQAAIEESRAMVTNDDLPVVRADAPQLVQVFQNLIANAIKFRRVDSPRVHVSARDLGREWEFSVKDNGIGIDAQYADRVFVIFQRLNTRQEYPGTGIGLAVCKRIVERHGGKIRLESKPGEGSTFFFTVPK